MARFRLSPLASADLAQILETSEDRWGATGRGRYAAILASAMRKVAADPQGVATRERTDLLPGIRSFHVRHARGLDPEANVRRPVHVLYYRGIAPGLIEIVRVLHERMEPSRHLRMEDTEDAG
jgi:toxin ParE1/3/4